MKKKRKKLQCDEFSPSFIRSRNSSFGRRLITYQFTEKGGEMSKLSGKGKRESNSQARELRDEVRQTVKRIKRKLRQIDRVDFYVGSRLPLRER